MIDDSVLDSRCHGHDNDDAIGFCCTHERYAGTHAGIVPVLLLPDAIRPDDCDIHTLDHAQSSPPIECRCNGGIFCDRITIDRYAHRFVLRHDLCRSRYERAGLG